MRVMVKLTSIPHAGLMKKATREKGFVMIVFRDIRHDKDKVVNEQSNQSLPSQGAVVKWVWHGSI